MDMRMIDFLGELKHETENACLFYDGHEDVWIPKSLIDSMIQVGSNKQDFEVIIPEWFAKKKGII